MMTGKQRFQGIHVSSIIVALALVFLFSGCTTELLDTVQKMVEFSNRDDKDAPQIIFTTPSYGAQGVPKNYKVTVTFDEPMDPETINNSSFTVETSDTAQPGTVTYVESYNMAMWTPTFPFYSIAVYTGRIRTSARDASGNRLQSEYTWNFQTGTDSDTTRPTLDFSFPGVSAQDVGINIDIAAGFDEHLDPSSVNESTFGVWLGSEKIAGTVRYIDSSSQIKFVPSGELLPMTWYTVKVSPEIKDLAGNAFGGSGAEWTFETGATSDIDPPQIDFDSPPVPQHGDVNLKINVPDNTVSVSFDEAMNPETIDNTTFTLEDDEGPVEGTVSYLPSTYTAVFLPNGDLEYMTLHTASVSGAVEDVAGNQLGTGYSWSFMTVANDPGTSSVTANIVKVTDASGKVSAYVLFTDQNGNALTGLTKYHFKLQEKVDPDDYSPVSSDALGMGSSRQSKSVVLLIDDTPSMSSDLNYLKAAITNIILGDSFGQFDSAMLATFASMSTGAPRVMLYPTGVQAPADGQLISDRFSLQSYLNAITIFSSPGYSAVHDAIGYSMEDMMAQSADEMVGLRAVIAFTDVTPPPAPYFFDGAYNNSAVLNYASSNNILIYAISEKFATEAALPQYANLGYSTSGYYRYSNNPGEYAMIYDEVLNLMHDQLEYVYKISWFTSYSSGLLDVEFEVNYSTQTGGDFSYTDTEPNYPL